MKVCVEAKKRKHFKKLDRAYNTENVESEWFYGKNTVIDITDGCYYHSEYAKEDGYKILTYKQWKAVMNGGNEDICIKVKTKEMWNELMEYYNVEFEWTFCKYTIKNRCIDVRGEWEEKEWFEEAEYLIISYKEWKALRR